MKRKQKQYFSKIKRLFQFPQVRIFAILFVMAIVMITVSYNLENTFWSSFCSNVSAGLFTGLVICLVSGSKSAFINRLEQKRVWLDKLHSMIMDYMDLWNKYISNNFDPEEEYDFVYDMGAHANWVNDFILQSQFDKRNHFNGVDLCRKDFNYDAMKIVEEQALLKDQIMEDNWNKKDVLSMFGVVDKQLRTLNNSILQEIDSIDRTISRCNKTLI